MINRNVFASFLLTAGVLLAQEAKPTPAGPHWNPNMSAPLSRQRIDTVPESQQAAWIAYWNRSGAAKQLTKSALAAELKSQSLAQPLPPPVDDADFVVDRHKPAAWFGSPAAIQLADTLVSFQLPSGGWSKLVGYKNGPRQPGMAWFTLAFHHWEYGGTFDNHSTTEQIKFLAKVYQATKVQKYADAVLRGLDYVFAAQYPNGGWPQFYPLEGIYHDTITLNDNAMIHVLEFVGDVASNDADYSFVDGARRQRARQAWEAGVQLLLKCQVVRDGQLTVWGQQHDPLTLNLAGARMKEPPSLSGAESAGVLEYLMLIKNPSPEIVRSIEAGLAWFQKNGHTGIKETAIKGFTYYEPDPASKTIWWARFCDPQTDQPIFCGSEDGVIYNSFQAMWDAGNRATYRFYTARPILLVGREQQAWRKMLASSQGAASNIIPQEKP